MNCPICDGEMRPRYATRDLSRPTDPTIWQVGWCDQCDFGRIINPVTPETVSSFYGSDYYTHAGTTYDEPSLLERIKLKIAYQFDDSKTLDPAEFGPANGRSMCDLGCGGGYWVRAFEKAGWKAVGVEPDEAARTRALGQGVAVYSGTAEALPQELSGQRFDLVLMHHSLEHCLDPIRAIRGAQLLLKPGGTLSIEVPNNAAVGLAVLGERWPWADIPRHLSFFTEDSLRLLMRKLGFAVSNVFYTGYFRQFSKQWVTQSGSRPWVVPLLLKTARAEHKLKYDSVRVHAVTR